LVAKQIESDVLIIGGGAAGLTLALKLADSLSIRLISKGILREGSTFYAQGGIAAVNAPDDSLNSHIEDTINAGAGLCDPAAVRLTVEHAAENIQWLIDKGISFTRNTTGSPQGEYHLTREGGHSHRRVFHATDATGKAIETTLEQCILAHSNIQVDEQHIAVDLITTQKLGLAGNNRCLGAYILDRGNNQVDVYRARFVIFATGGTSKVYLYTSNPDTATGEGGKLCLPDGSRFMDAYDKRAELAPRDIVARAIDHEMKRLGCDNVFLDISHKPADFITRHFPTIHQRCLELGIDITREPIPVVPAAHYTCGGIMTDLHGQTDIANLYAIGEAAFTGLHGANRMASNSLLECLVFAQAASKDILRQHQQTAISANVPEWDESRVTDSDEEIVVHHNWDEVRRMMWDYVGIVRSDKRLQRSQRRVDMLKREIDEYYGNFRVTNDLLELRNLVVMADLIIRSAISRKESRGLHYNLDYPQTDPRLNKNTILTPENFVRGKD